MSSLNYSLVLKRWTSASSVTLVSIPSFVRLCKLGNLVNSADLYTDMVSSLWVSYSQMFDLHSFCVVGFVDSTADQFWNCRLYGS